MAQQEELTLSNEGSAGVLWATFGNGNLLPPLDDSGGKLERDFSARVRQNDFLMTIPSSVPTASTIDSVQVDNRARRNEDDPDQDNGALNHIVRTNGGSVRSFKTEILSDVPTGYSTRSGTATTDGDNNPWTYANVNLSRVGYRLNAASLNGTDEAQWSLIQAFLNFTLPVPTLTTDPAENVQSTQADLKGTIDPNTLTSTYDAEVTFEWGTDVMYGNETAIQTFIGDGDMDVTQNITGLVENTLYHFRIKAVTDDATTFGADQTFTATSQDFPLLVL